VAGYLIAVIAFSIPLAFGATGFGRPRMVIGLGAVMASIWAVALVTGRAQDGQGNQIAPVWFLAGLVALLYVLWCGGLWLGLRLRKVRAR
jgi:type VI protein secretion system component VasK